MSIARSRSTLVSVALLWLLFTRKASSFCSISNKDGRQFRADHLQPLDSKREGYSEMDAIEKEVISSAQARIDIKNLMKLLDDEDNDSSALTTWSSSGGGGGTTTMEQWKIALAAASVGSAATLFFTKNLTFSAFALVLVFLAANGDPLEEDNLAGALARVVGRLTIRSVEASQPKVKALARAVVTGEEEIVALKKRLRLLEEENQQLKTWKQNRLKVDEALPQFSLEDLKEVARENGVTLGGTKSQLLMRLVEAGYIKL